MNKLSAQKDVRKQEEVHQTISRQLVTSLKSIKYV